MTQVFREDGTVVPVTRVQAGPCVVTQVKTKEKDGQAAVQIGYGEKKLFRVSKPQQGHLKGLPTVAYMRDAQTDQDLKRGDTFNVSIFEAGEKVSVVGWSKGKGFQGVVKRHGFHGAPASHGHKDQLRMPGSIGAGGVQRVFKGKRMAGHTGDAQVTVKNLEVVEIHPEINEIFIKGAVPGARGGFLIISTKAGQIDIKVQSEKDEEVEVEVKKEDAEVVETKNEEEVKLVDDVVTQDTPKE